MNDAEILAAVEGGLVAQGNGQMVIEPRVHLEPNPDFHGHFNVLRGYVAPLETAGVKIVGDYVDNYLHACRPSSASSSCLIRAPECRAPSSTQPSLPACAQVR
jgi:ornithine cyclodeaminase/alanine dehydrogenase-like protein (mu-crystallin family)